MVSLKTNFAGIELRNPVVVAPSPATETVANIIKCERAGAAAVITKSIADYEKTESRLGQRRVLFSEEYSPSFLTWIISSYERETYPLRYGIDLIKAAKKHVNIPVIGSVTALTYEKDAWHSASLALEEAGADAIELSLYYLPHPCTSHNTEKLVNLFEYLSNEISIPLIPKLHIEIPANFAVNLLKNSRVDGVSYLDSIEVPPPIDVKGKGVPRHIYVEKPNICSVFGNWQKPLTLRYTYILAKSTRFPLCAGGGLLDGSDAIELIMLGATITQFASSIMAHGYGWITRIIDDMTNILNCLRCENVNEIRGLSYRYFGETSETLFLNVKAAINQKLCIHSGEITPRGVIRCRRCLDLAICDAIFEKEGIIRVNQKLCEGCGLCVAVCPEEAIKLLRSESTLQRGRVGEET